MCAEGAIAKVRDAIQYAGIVLCRSPLMITLCAMGTACTLLEELPEPRVPPTVHAPAHFDRPVYSSGNALPAHYRVIEPERSCRRPRSEPIVFLHGLGDVGYSLVPLAESAAPCFRRVIVDLPGSGESPTASGAEAITLGHVLGSIASIIETEAPGGRAILVGHSLGGTLALRLAARYPERIAGLVVISAPNDRFSLGEKQRFLLEHWRSVMPGIRLLGPYTTMGAAYRSMLPPGDAGDAVSLSLVARQWEDSARAAAFEGYTRFILHSDEMDKMIPERTKVQAHTLFVYGSDDSWEAPPLSDFGSAKTREFNELDGVGHLPHVEAPRRLAAVLSRFLTRFEPTGPPAPSRRRRVEPEIEAGEDIYGPFRELFPVVGAGYLYSRGALDPAALIGLAKGSVDTSYPLEAGRAVFLWGGGLRRANGDSPEFIYARFTGRVELVWRWYGGLLLEGTGLAADGANGGYGAIGYVPSVIPWTRAFIGYGALPRLGAGAIAGVELNLRVNDFLF